VLPVLAEMYRPAAAAMIADLVEPERRPQAYGLQYVAVNLGFAIGAILGGVLATVWYTWLFWVDALTAAVYALIIIFLIGETLGRTGEGPDDGRAAPPRFEALGHIVRDRTFLVFCGGSLLCGLVFMQFLSTFPLQLHQKGMGPDMYGRLISINGVMIVLFQLPVAAVITRFHRGTVIILAATVLGFGFGSTALAVTAWHFALVVILCTCAELMQAPLMSPIVTDMAPARFRATYLGVLTMCFSSANMLGAPIGGAVLAKWGGSYLWGGCFVVGLAAAAMYASIRRRLVTRET
jgi:MFS family permease